MDLTAADIATMTGGSVVGDPAVRITGVNSIEDAGPGDLCFVRSAEYAEKLKSSQAAATLIQAAPDGLSMVAIVVPNPDLAFALVLKHCESLQLQHPEGIDARAAVHPEAQVGPDVAVGACAVVEAGAVLERGAIVYPGAYVGRNSHIGAGTILYPNVTVREYCRIGARCIIHAGATIGSDGFGYARMEGTWVKIPQVGRVDIEDDVEIGSGTAVDRATMGVTRIGQGTKIDNLCQVGHNVQIGEHCALAGMVGVAGSAVLKDRVQVGASAGIKGHLTVGDDATVAARGGVIKSVEPGAVVSGFPAIDHLEERRVLVAQRRVPELIRRLKVLERELDAVKEQLHE